MAARLHTTECAAAPGFDTTGKGRFGFCELRGRANPGLPSSTGVKITFVSNLFLDGASQPLAVMPFPEDSNGNLLPVELGAFRSIGTIVLDADEMIVQYV